MAQWSKSTNYIRVGLSILDRCDGIDSFIVMMKNFIYLSQLSICHVSYICVKFYQLQITIY